MYYSFNSEIAEAYGVDEAIFINNMLFWVAKNKANNKNFHDGHYWTYNSQEALAKLFPFWNKDKIKRIVKKLKEQGVLLVGNYNKSAYDRTNWYSIDENLINGRKSHSAKTHNQKGENVQPIPDINPDIKENILKEKHPQSNPSFDRRAITEDAEQKRSIGRTKVKNCKEYCSSQELSLFDNTNTPLENNNTVNARQGISLGNNNSQESYDIPENKDLSRKAVDNWNYIAEEFKLPTIKVLTSARISKLKARIKQVGGWKEFWQQVYDAISQSKFLKTGNETWKCNFDFVLQESSFVKMIEHQYK